MSATLIRADLRSLPGANDYNYDKDIFFIEEGTRSIDLFKTVKAKLRDFDGLFGDLEQKDPILHEALKPLRLALRPLLNGELKTNKYGLNTSSILEILGAHPENILEIINALEKIVASSIVFEEPPSIVLSNEEKQLKKTNPKAYEAKKRLNTMARNWDKAEYFKAFLDKLEDLYVNWLIPFLKVWSKQEPGAIRLTNWGELEITTRNLRAIEILKAAKTRIWLDATPDITLITSALEIEPNSILKFTRDVPCPSNLTIQPIAVSGISSRDWGKPALERVKAIKEQLNSWHPNLKELGYKYYAEELGLDGWWGNHNRGTNQFIGVKEIALYGLPTPNLGRVEDEYLSLFGHLEGFIEYYQAKVQAEVIQAVGRQRVHLSPETQYTIYLVATFSHFDTHCLASIGCKVNPIMDSFELTPLAGDKAQQKQYNLVQVLLDAVEKGKDIKKMSEEWIAQQMGISQQRVSQLMQQFTGGRKQLKILLISLYETLYRKTSKITAHELIQKSQDLREWLKLPPILETEELLNLASQLAQVEFASKLLKIETYILNHPHPIIVLGHLWSLITEEDTLEHPS